MAARIEVEKVKEDEFQVRVSEAKSESTHRVTLTQAEYRRLSGGRIEPEKLVRLSFEFLVARESKESILPEFDLPLDRSLFSGIRARTEAHDLIRSLLHGIRSAPIDSPAPAGHFHPE